MNVACRFLTVAVVAAASFLGAVEKGDDKYAETSNAKEKDEKVAFVAKVHEVGLPLKYSAYVIKGTDKANAPVYVMMEYEKPDTAPMFEEFAAEGLIPPGLMVFVSNDSLMPTMKGGFPRYMRGEAFGRVGRGFPCVLIDELIPAAAKQCGVTVSADPDLHFISGSSAGGGATLNAVWYRNDYFHRAYAASPYVDSGRGAEDLLRLIRMTETKPLRIYLTTGDKEPDRTAGDLFWDNMQLRSAFDFAGYPCELEYFPKGGHNTGKGNPVTMRRMVEFVWKDWKTSKVVPERNPARVASLVALGTGWTEVGRSGVSPLGTRTDDPQTKRRDAASPDAASPVRAAGGEYSYDGGKILFTKGGATKVVADSFAQIEGLSLSCDGWRLYVIDAKRRDIFALAVNADGSLGFPFQLAPIRLAYNATRLGASDILTLENDRVLVATELGVQSAMSFGVLDIVLPLPGDLPVDRIWMDGKTLYAQSGARVFRRELLVGVAQEGVKTKPHHYYYGIPGENKYSDHRPQFEESFKTLKSVVITNRIER